MGFSKLSIEQRFMKKVELIPFHTCWEWIASKHRFGYGWFRYDNKADVAHRVSYLLFKGPIDKHKHVLHSCDNPSCVNPSHLRLGSDQENSRDKLDRNRQAKGVDNGGKLTNAEVLQLREEHKLTKQSYLALAKKYNISQTAAFFIMNRKTWRHL